MALASRIGARLPNWVSYTNIFCWGTREEAERHSTSCAARGEPKGIHKLVRMAAYMHTHTQSTVQRSTCTCNSVPHYRHLSATRQTTPSLTVAHWRIPLHMPVSYCACVERQLVPTRTAHPRQAAPPSRCVHEIRASCGHARPLHALAAL